eukprot:TRINITY_DN79841_c0_g1_i1.p1 TRINITY_DN79841_c0_g1~~TRINITY_DN79841_c0_g1_i1.p1  ORF type:complete len:252 (+),score=41.32 TRINITY_DN79841_c0_g1_i1:79-756(+)
MLQASLGVVADSSSRSGFIDFDAAPEEGAPISEVVQFLLSPQAKKLRLLLNAELSYGLDLALRNSGRRLRNSVRELLVPRIPLLGLRLPQPPLPPLLLPVPTGLDEEGGAPSGLTFMSADEVFDAVLPELTTSEDVDLETFREAAQGMLLDGQELPEPSPEVLLALLRSALSGGESAAQELADSLRHALSGPQSRRVLTDEVVLAIASELLRTWRARLSASTSKR